MVTREGRKLQIEGEDLEEIKDHTGVRPPIGERTTLGSEE